MEDRRCKRKSKDIVQAKNRQTLMRHLAFADHEAHEALQGLGPLLEHPS